MVYDGRPGECENIRITADTRYKLFVNGAHVQSGSSKGWKYQDFDDSGWAGVYLYDPDTIGISAKVKDILPERQIHQMIFAIMKTG